MSQLKVNTIRHTGASSDAVTLATDGTCTAKITDSLSNRNLIINGAMNVHQRGGTTTGEGYLLDRWHIYSNPTAKHTVSQDTETPVGFKYSMKWLSASAYTPSSGNYFYTGQRIEGHNWDQMEYGTANAKTCTVSFWVRSSITGTWSGILKNNAQDRTYPWEYTISSANTWEKKTVTIPGCTDGTWLSGNNAGAWLYFCIGSTTSGTTYLGSANSWQSTNLIGTTGSNSLVNTNGATLYITGVQLEVGDVATDFEHRSYGDEMERCKRYYFEFGGSTAETDRFLIEGYTKSTSYSIVSHISYNMRAAPAVTKAGSWSEAHVGSMSFNYRDTIQCGVRLIADGNDTCCYAHTDGDSYLKFDAEL